MKVVFEPRSIEFHFSTVNRFGGDAVGVEIDVPQFHADVRLPGGGYGSVALPLDIDERAFLKEIVTSVLRRAQGMVENTVGESPQKR